MIRDILKIVDTAKEGKFIIKSREILVDGKPRTDYKYPVGLFDVVQIPKLKKYYRLIPTRVGLGLIEIPKKEANLKLCRINGKRMVKGGLIQLNCHDGRCILTKKKTYKTGDSLLLELPSQKILEHLKIGKGMLGVITGGSNKGELIKIKDVITTRSREPNKVVCVKDGKEFEAIKDYVFVIGKEKPMIKIK